MKRKEDIVMKKMMKKALALLLGTMMVVGLAACGSSNDDKTTEAAGEQKEKLTVGISGDYAPYEFYAEVDGKRQLVGADVELAKYIADELGMELELVDMSFDGLLGSLGEGKFDLVISGMSIRGDRDCLFSDPYFSAEQALLVPAGQEDAYASLDDLMGKKIGGQMSALQQELAETYAGDGAQIVANVQDMIMMVSESKLDGMFCEKAVAQSAASKSDKVAVANLEVPAEENNLGVCMKTGDTEMAEKINPIIAEVLEKNLYGEWLAKYLDVEEDVQ